MHLLVYLVFIAAVLQGLAIATPTSTVTDYIGKVDEAIKQSSRTASDNGNNRRMLQSECDSDSDVAFWSAIQDCQTNKIMDSNLGLTSDFCDIFQLTLDVTFECIQEAPSGPCKDLYGGASCQDTIDILASSQGDQCSLSCNSGLSAGAIAGIVIGTLIVLGLGCFCCVKMRKDKSSHNQHQEPTQASSNEVAFAPGAIEPITKV